MTKTDTFGVTDPNSIDARGLSKWFGATQVLNDTCSAMSAVNPGAAPGGGAPGTMGRTGVRVNAVDMRLPLNEP